MRERDDGPGTPSPSNTLAAADLRGVRHNKEPRRYVTAGALSFAVLARLWAAVATALKP